MDLSMTSKFCCLRHQFPHVEYCDCVATEARRDLIAGGVPIHFEDPAVPAVFLQ